MSVPTVQISEASHQLLEKLVEQTGQTMMDVVDKALDAFRRPEQSQRPRGEMDIDDPILGVFDWPTWGPAAAMSKLGNVPCWS